MRVQQPSSAEYLYPLALDQISGMQAVDVGAEHFATGLVEQQLHQTIALQLGQGLGIGLEVAAHAAELKPSGLLAGEQNEKAD